MGLTHVTTVRDLAKQGKPYEGEFLLDTGAIDSLAPSAPLHASGIVPEHTQRYELANGDAMEFEVGFARLSLVGLETVTPIIFGLDNAEPILGVVVLESLGLVVNPVTNELNPMDAKPLKYRGSMGS